MKGRQRLRQALAAMYSPIFQREVDPETDIVITTGANEGQKAFLLMPQFSQADIITQASSARLWPFWTMEMK